MRSAMITFGAKRAWNWKVGIVHLIVIARKDDTGIKQGCHDIVPFHVLNYAP